MTLCNEITRWQWALTYLKAPASLSCALVIYSTPESNTKYLQNKKIISSNFGSQKNLLQRYSF
jgi:hypothetical protein